MKKLFTISLLALLLFNCIGYRYVLNYLEKKSSVNLNKAIEKNNYSEDDLVEIKVPLNNPYISDHNYEDAYGETTVKGKSYQYVKKKISENTLYLMCLPNEEKAALATTKNNLGGTHAQSAPNKNSQKNPVQHIIKAPQTEYLQTNEFLFANMFTIQNDAQSFLMRNTNCTNQFYLLTDAQPPENLI